MQLLEQPVARPRTSGKSAYLVILIALHCNTVRICSESENSELKTLRPTQAHMSLEQSHFGLNIYSAYSLWKAPIVLRNNKQNLGGTGLSLLPLLPWGIMYSKPEG